MSSEAQQRSVCGCWSCWSCWSCWGCCHHHCRCNHWNEWMNELFEWIVWMNVGVEWMLCWVNVQWMLDDCWVECVQRMFCSTNVLRVLGFNTRLFNRIPSKTPSNRDCSGRWHPEKPRREKEAAAGRTNKLNSRLTTSLYERLYIIECLKEIEYLTVSTIGSK